RGSSPAREPTWRAAERTSDQQRYSRTRPARRRAAGVRAPVPPQLCIGSLGSRCASGGSATHPRTPGDRHNGALHAYRRSCTSGRHGTPPHQRFSAPRGTGRMNTLDPLIEGHLSYLREVGRKAPRTVVDVRCTLKRAAEAFASLRPQVPLWRLTLQDYLHWFEAERSAGRSAGSIAKQASHLRGLLEYVWRSGRAERNVLDGLNLHAQVKSQAPNFLTLEQAEQLVRACPRSSAAERRDRLMILLLYGCGLRTAELCALDVADVV